MLARLLILLSALLLVPAAGAYHNEEQDGHPMHWSASQLAGWNGFCSSDPRALCFIVDDRTGFGLEWSQNVMRPAMSAWATHIAAQTNHPVLVSFTVKPRFKLFDNGTYHFAEAYALNPTGHIMVAWQDGLAAWMQVDDHFTECVAGVDKTLATTKHELGHCIGLGHRKLDANFNCDGKSVMCALGFTAIDAHDDEALKLAYNHAD